MAYLVLMEDSQSCSRFALKDDCLTIGRSPGSDIFLDDPSVSHHHAQLHIECEEEYEQEEHQQSDLDCRYRVVDQGSTNGTYVNNKKIDEAELKHNDLLVIGLNNFRFVDEEKSALEKTQQIKKSWLPGVFYLKDKK
ncbi:FHA domain-containing protein [Pleionea sp. CnH1-48]|uniref:FHA domain-containing protein n=1 Tax=Pleionea sp. CnH1-48 TaxID=2954494 RepID=UPI0020973AA1|nr:FHA domain-containing protein [Pleionea sp. CnH1-48]MCO7224829.1 FHA domain-containing protein [Pleionea sp. CnH1-48]